MSICSNNQDAHMLLHMYKLFMYHHNDQQWGAAVYTHAHLVAWLAVCGCTSFVRVNEQGDELLSQRVQAPW